jgi:hypothetical protein
MFHPAAGYRQYPARVERDEGAGYLPAVSPATSGLAGQMELADLANGVANSGCGRRRMQLDPAAVRGPCEQATGPLRTDLDARNLAAEQKVTLSVYLEADPCL